MSEPVHCLVFSKDRPMQLDAFLRSAVVYAPYTSIIVQIAQMTHEYGQLMDEWLPESKHVRFMQDLDDFEVGVRWFLEAHERVAFHTDDDIWFRRPEPSVFDRGVVTSYRLGRNTVRCHPLGGIPQAVPGLFPVWRWRNAELDFAYPLSLNGHVFSSADLLPLLDFFFANPTELEAQLAARADRFPVAWLAAVEQSCVVSLPHNVVSTSSGNPRGSNPLWQPEALTEAYLDGWRIDLDALDFTVVDGAHCEVPLVFKHV